MANCERSVSNLVINNGVVQLLTSVIISTMSKEQYPTAEEFLKMAKSIVHFSTNREQMFEEPMGTFFFSLAYVT